MRACWIIATVALVWYLVPNIALAFLVPYQGSMLGSLLIPVFQVLDYGEYVKLVIVFSGTLLGFLF